MLSSAFITASVASASKASSFVSYTLTIAIAFFVELASEVAVTIVSPIAIAVTSPVLLTEAIVASSTVHLTDLLVALGAYSSCHLYLFIYTHIDD